MMYFQSNNASRLKDIHVWGFAVDLANDYAASWGGSDLFHETKQRFPGQIAHQLNEMKGLMQ